ncbi:hypothetical protein ACFW04_013994 [Cataglyphis niger]
MDPNIIEPWIYPLFYPFGRRLYHQWLVDSYVKIEKDRIDYCKNYQKELRTETCQGLKDYIQTMANNLNRRIGKMPRNMLQNYQDAMAIVSKFGKPDLFITMIYPKWPSDRPDICVRVFNIKKDYLNDLIVKQQFFGEVVVFVYVIEFQKRCLLHVHMLITLKYNFKITTPQIIDKYISAEIPDPCENGILHDILIIIMLFHCPILSIIFNCHINVEIVSSIKSVKYLYKYIYKGHDVAVINIEPITENVIIDHDEIHNYIEARYVGPVEASWRVLGKKLQAKNYTIMRLPVHLSNEQNIIIKNKNIEDAITSALNQVIMLIDYFSLNLRDEEAKQYLYIEIPCYYTFKKEKINGRNVSRWIKRKSHYNCIGQIYSVSPAQTKLYHLRLLLLTVKGAISFNDLRTVNEEFCQSFSAACLALGLTEDDDEWKQTMNEAVGWMMP